MVQWGKDPLLSLLWCKFNLWPGNFFFFVSCILRAAPVAYGGSQARGLIGVVTASLHQAEPHL